MGTGRLEAFSDGVIAIIITIMVLELKAPHGENFADLLTLVPAFLSYVLSFLYVAIYWNNHHHLMHATHKVTGAVLWGNLHLLFWLSLFPFATAWMGENHFGQNPTLVYGIVLFMAAVAFVMLQRSIIPAEGSDSTLKQAIGKDRKGKTSLVLYALGILCTFWLPAASLAIYALVALMWLIPDQRIARVLS